MHGVPTGFDHLPDQAQFMRPVHRAGVELYRAHIVRHAFEPHTHEAYGLGSIEAGVERFRYRGADHLASAGSVVLMNPDELHTGKAETEGGWRYRMLYLDVGALQEFTGEPAWWFDQAVQHDPAAAATVAMRLDQLWAAREPLAFDSALIELLDTLRRFRQGPSSPRKHSAPRFADVLDHLRETLDQPQDLESLAALAGLSPFHFLRSFRQVHGATPQQMLMALRLFEAKRQLAAGLAPAAVAAATGLADQAHLTRAFARRYGVTPGRYQQQLGTRPTRAP